VKLKVCTLTPAQHQVQRGRYARLRGAIESVDREPLELTIRFAHDVDAELLAETVAIERECCAFLDIRQEGRVLRMSSDDSHDLDPFERALR
jgi:hypothetical protein